MNAPTLPAEITAFAAAVRAALADLPPEEVEELTEGLEADLAEAYAEDLARELPDPDGYAAELRRAAGLPSPERRSDPLRRTAEDLRSRLRDLNLSLRSSPAMDAVLDFLVSLRPAWWLVRGWAAYQIVGVLFGVTGDLMPGSLVLWVLLGVMVAGSVVVGLRGWPAWMRGLIVAGNAFAVIVTLSVLSQVPTRADLDAAWFESSTAEMPYVGDAGGLMTTDGRQVTNIFAYDATGAPVSGVQLFDQDGRPLTTSAPGGDGCLVEFGPDDADACKVPGAWVPVVLETGATAWNVYPMRMVESTLDDPTQPVAGAEPQDRPAPYLKVPALMSAVEDAPKAGKKSEKNR